MQLLNTTSCRTSCRLHICNLIIVLSLLLLHAESVNVKLCYVACLSREVLHSFLIPFRCPKGKWECSSTVSLKGSLDQWLTEEWESVYVNMWSGLLDPSYICNAVWGDINGIYVCICYSGLHYQVLQVNSSVLWQGVCMSVKCSI